VAKRKSTDKTSNKETKDAVSSEGPSDPKTSTDTGVSDMDTAKDAVEAVDAYAPADEVAKKDDDTPSEALSDDIVEQEEPKSDDATSETVESGAESVNASASQGATDSAKDDGHISEEEAEELIEDAETLEGHPNKADPVETADTERDALPVAPQIVRETTVERKGGFLPMLLGGAAAAVLGYGVAAYVSQDVWPFAAVDDSNFEDEIRAALTDQDGSLSDLGTRIATLEAAEAPTVDLTPIEEQITAVQSTTADLSSRLDEIVARIDTLERQPMEQAVSPEAIAAYERALADLQAEVEAQRAEVAQMAEEAVAAEENAEEKAALAASRAALAEITAALENGSGFSGAVQVLTSNSVDVPAPLSDNAETGVPTQSDLMTTFPDAARSALSAARTVQTESSEGTGRIATFFANQLGARSVAPREGNDPDAILSRAEAAVRSGDLETALSELSALPEVAQAALSDWQSRAQTRLEAQTAADGLVQQLLQE
jgi:hypothetical protein